MKTRKQLEAEFITDFQSLLNKHRAEFDLYSDDGYATITISAVYENNECVSDYAYFRLNNFYAHE